MPQYRVAGLSAIFKAGSNDSRGLQGISRSSRTRPSPCWDGLIRFYKSVRGEPLVELMGRGRRTSEPLACRGRWYSQLRRGGAWLPDAPIRGLTTTSEVADFYPSARTSPNQRDSLVGGGGYATRRACWGICGSGRLDKRG